MLIYSLSLSVDGFIAPAYVVPNSKDALEAARSAIGWLPLQERNGGGTWVSDSRL
jgi:hypothetical protein